MARTRYGARRRPVEERSDPLAALGSFLTDLGMEMSPAVNAYRAGEFSENYPVTPFATAGDRFRNMLREPEYQRYLDNIASAGMGATTKATKVGKAARPKVDKKAKYYEDNKKKVASRLEKARQDLGDQVYLDPEKEVTGSFRVADDVPLTFRGKEPYEWTPEDLAAFEAKFGQAGDLQFSPMITQKLQDGGTVNYPAGFDGKYSLGDQYRILAEGLDPNRLSPEDYWAMQSKKVASVDPNQYREGLTDNQVYNALMFGLTSPNNPLDPNLMAVNRLRSTGPEDIAFMADQIPWRYNSPDKVYKDLTKDWTVKKKKITERVEGEDGKKVDQTKMVKVWHGPDGKPLKAGDRLLTYSETKGGKDNRKQAIKALYNSRIQDAFGLQAGPRGGIGAGGSANYTNLAEFAQMFQENPQWFRQKPDEDWVRYTQRLSSQLEGLGYKTASMADVWTNPAKAQIAPVDRHMGQIMTRDNPSWQQEMVDRWNSGFGGQKRPPVQSYEELTQVPGGAGYISEQSMNYAYGPKSGGKYKLKGGARNPELPDYIYESNFFRDPESVEMIPQRYVDVLDHIEKTGESKAGAIFPSQWGLWDLIRKRNAPHQVMNPALENYPKMSSDQMQRVRKQYSDNEFLTYRDSKTKEMKPSGKADNPMDLFMLSKVGPVLGPAALGGSLLYEDD